jgi:hypothetical protein
VQILPIHTQGQLQDHSHYGDVVEAVGFDKSIHGSQHTVLKVPTALLVIRIPYCPGSSFGSGPVRIVFLLRQLIALRFLHTTKS